MRGKLQPHATIAEIYQDKAVDSWSQVARVRRAEDASKPVKCKPRPLPFPDMTAHKCFHNPRKERCMWISQRDIDGAQSQISAVVVG